MNILRLFYRWILFLFVFFCLTSKNAHAVTITVDNINANNTAGNYSESAGSTSFAESDAASEYLGSSRYIKTANEYSTWTPTLPMNGNYQVQAWWNCEPSKADDNAKYTVTHSTGTTNVFVSQTGLCGQWNNLGTFSLLTATAKVILTNVRGNNYRPNADAIRFIEADSDGDGVSDSQDQCPGFDDNINSDSASGDTVPDGCDICPGFNDATDTDGDGVPDGCDICPGFNDSIDADGDGVPNGCDICPGFNDATDTDGDGVPDGCDICAGFNDSVNSDSASGDTVPDGCDTCPGFNDTLDGDGDGVADGCDQCPGFNDNTDSDLDGVADGCDVCPGFNDATDVNLNGIPDGCDFGIDSDGDGVSNAFDVCPGFDDNDNEDGFYITNWLISKPSGMAGTYNQSLVEVNNTWLPSGFKWIFSYTTDNDLIQVKYRFPGGEVYNWITCNRGSDCSSFYFRIPSAGWGGDWRHEDKISFTVINGDTVPDGCDQCPGFNDTIDADGDGVADGCDQCPGFNDFTDEDLDGIPDGCDPSIDSDGDGVNNIDDKCPGFDDNLNADSATGDTVPDDCDICPGFNDATDTDGDGVPNGCDVCEGHPDSVKTDIDNVPDGCDICPGFDDNIDSDGDGVPDGCDQCAGFDDSIDVDADGIIDGCDPLVDSDGDNVADSEDQCPGFNDGVDEDVDGIPDGCDPLIDTDNDTVADPDDICWGYNDLADSDSDGVPDGCDVCNGYDDTVDTDGDAIPDGCDAIVDVCGGINISDTVLDTLVSTASANIMFIIDDNATMDQEVMTPEDNTKFDVSGAKVSYIFESADHANSGTDTNGKRLGGHQQVVADKGRWKSQWSGYNYIYYDPFNDYAPWPSTAAHPFNDVNLNTPVCDPVSTAVTPATLDMDGTYHTVGTVTINRAHYFVIDDLDGDEELDAGEAKYLVLLVQPTPGNYGIQYYLFTDSDNDNIVDSGELALTAVEDVPAAVKTGRSATQERQNFVNWYSYYRRRSKVVMNTTATTIMNLRGVNAGIFSVNANVNQPVLPVHVLSSDNTETLLDALYGYAVDTQHTANPTPRALLAVGYYFSRDEATPSNLNRVGPGPGEEPSPIAADIDGGSCQHNFAVILSDNNYQGQTATVGNVDQDKGAPYADGDQNTLADVAMKWWQTDIATTVTNSVPTNEADSANWQHVVTYGIGFGPYGYLNPDDYDIPHGVYPTWGNVNTNDQRTTMDNLWHATVNGRGEFVRARSPKALAAAMVSVINSIMARVGSGASVSINGDELYEEVGESVKLFQSSYNTGNWSGDVEAYSVNTSTGAVNSNADWSARIQLQNTITTGGHNSRVIATSDGTTGSPFRYANISAAQKAMLDANATTAENMVNYLRGDQTYESQNGGTFRDRDSNAILGDIVHSRAFFIEERLYVGANDGMLHVFDANTGDEKFAYIPNLVFGDLNLLADPSYTHRFFVDNTPYAREMGDKTYIVCGLNKGGKGYFCLDISDPANITTESILASRVKWEYPSVPNSDSDMGFTFSRPIIVDSNDRTINAADDDLIGHIVIFGNGYNSTSGKAFLYILNPETGAILRKFDTGVGCNNGLSTPIAIDVGADGRADYVYAGDLQGNLWKFDLTDPNYLNWGFAYKSGATPKPLFRTQIDATGKYQPITVKPDVMFACNGNHGYMVIFGTGRYVGDPDISDTQVQSIYGIWDYGDDADDSEYLGTFNPGAVAPDTPLSNQPGIVTLLEQTEIYSGMVDTNNDSVPDTWLRVLSNNVPNWHTEDDVTDGQKPNPGPADNPDPVHAGWYFDLPLSKEKTIDDVLIRDYNAIVISLIPESAPCSFGGRSIIHEMSGCTGGRLETPQFDITGDQQVNTQDKITITIPNPDNPDENITIDVAPTGVREEGRLFAPAILRKTPIEIKYFSSSTGVIETMTEKAEKLGLYFWQQME